MGLEDKIWNAILLPDRAVKTAIDGVAELATKAGTDRYRLSQVVIMSSGLMAGVKAAGYWLSEPQNVADAVWGAWGAAVNLSVYPFIITPQIKAGSLNSDVKSLPVELFLKFTRAVRFPLLLASISGVIGFYEGLDNIAIPDAVGEWQALMTSSYFYLIDGKTNRWDKLKEWYRKFEGNFSVRKTDAARN